MASDSLSVVQIELIRDSFVHVLFAREQAATLFYDRLFEIAPDTRPLFRGDIGAQGRVLIATLASIVAGLDRLEASIPTIRALGLRHVDYGVLPSHYPAVGDALLHMVATLAHGPLDPTTRAAWLVGYGIIADVMTGRDTGPAVIGPAA